MRGHFLVLTFFASAHIWAQGYNPLLLEASLGRGDTLGAIDYLRETLQKNPDVWQAQYNLGLLYFNTGKRAASAPHFSKALELNGALYEVHYFLGHYYFDLDSMGRAIESYSEYLQKNHDNLEVLHYRAQAYMRVHDFFPAVSDWTYLFNKTGEPSVVYNRALAYMGMNDHESARKDLRQVLELDPGNVNAYYYMGLSFERSYDHSDAMRWWKDLLDIDPDDHRALYQQAADLMNRGKDRRACKMLDSAVEKGYRMTEEDRELFADCM